MQDGRDAGRLGAGAELGVSRRGGLLLRRVEIGVSTGERRMVAMLIGPSEEYSEWSWWWEMNPVEARREKM